MNEQTSAARQNSSPQYIHPIEIRAEQIKPTPEQARDEAIDGLIARIQGPSAAITPVDYRTLLESFYANKKPVTLQTYRACLNSFREWLNVSSELEAVAKLLSAGPGGANLLALKWRSALLDAHWAPSTVNTKLAALRSVVAMANTIGLIQWSLRVKCVEHILYRDTRGCGREGFQAMLKEVKEQASPRAERDAAILWLLYGRALRREEVTTLRLEDFDPVAKTVAVIRKRMHEREVLTIADPIVDACLEWKLKRGDAPGPLFAVLDRKRIGAKPVKTRSGALCPLGGREIWRIVKNAGRKCGIDARPHGLRHAAITEALNVSNGDVRAVQRFSGHKSVQTVLIYDDNRKDLGGDLSRKISSPAPKLFDS